jgi:hypothetical protein
MNLVLLFYPLDAAPPGDDTVSAAPLRSRFPFDTAIFPTDQTGTSPLRYNLEHASLMSRADRELHSESPPPVGSFQQPCSRKCRSRISYIRATCDRNSSHISYCLANAFRARLFTATQTQSQAISAKMESAFAHSLTAAAYSSASPSLVLQALRCGPCVLFWCISR